MSFQKKPSPKHVKYFGSYSYVSQQLMGGVGVGKEDQSLNYHFGTTISQFVSATSIHS